jgi:hypothetical protein
VRRRWPVATRRRSRAVRALGVARARRAGRDRRAPRSAKRGAWPTAARAFRAARREGGACLDAAFRCHARHLGRRVAPRDAASRARRSVLTRAAAAFDRSSPRHGATWRGSSSRSRRAWMASHARRSPSSVLRAYVAPVGDRKEEARVRLFEARVDRRPGRSSASRWRGRCGCWIGAELSCAVRKERDVAGPLLAADGARGTRLRSRMPRRDGRATRRAHRAIARRLRRGARPRARAAARTAARQLIALLALYHGRPQGARR